MPSDFQLAAIVKRAGMPQLLQIPLQQTLQDSLAELWWEQYERFVEGVDEIGFQAGYQLENHERFCIAEYSLPRWLSRETGETVPELETLGRNGAKMPPISGVVAFARQANGEECLLFQNFTRSKVIEPGRFLFLTEDTYASTESPGLTLDHKMSATFERSEGKLLFSSFRTVNTFLPLADYYREASEQEIEELLAHPRFILEDPATPSREWNQWFRKRFSMLRDSGILEEYSATEIEQRARGYDVGLVVRDDQVVFPEDAKEAKKLLQFLNEELFRGAITETLYETNSKRAAS